MNSQLNCAGKKYIYNFLFPVLVLSYHASSDIYSSVNIAGGFHIFM